MEGTVGEIQLFGGTFAPASWAYCQGQLLPIAQYEALWSLLGTSFGGDGQQTFGLPNLPSPLPATGMKYIICLDGIFPSRP